MANTVSTIFVKTFEANVRHLAQQGNYRVRPWVTERSPGHSSGHQWERLGRATVAQKTTRLQATPVNDQVWSRRQSIPTTWNTGDSSEQEDIVQMLVDPNSNLTMSQAMALRRTVDTRILGVASGNIATVDGTGATVAWLAAQTVGNGTTGLTFDMITNVTQIFATNDVDPDEPKVFVIAPIHARKLLQLTEASNADYNSLRPLESGQIARWMGYTWVVSNYLAVPSANQFYAVAMTKRAIGMTVERDISTRVAEDPTVSFAWRIYSYMTFGLARVEDEHVVRIHTTDAL